MRILAQGNFSLDAGGLVNLLLALSFVTLCLAGALAWQGYWPILLIAVVQLALVGWILVRAWQRTWASEVIEVSAERIRVTQQRHKQKRQMDLATAWAVVRLKQPDVAWYGPGIELRSGSSNIELGRFLIEKEKQQLFAHLKSAIEQHSAMKGALNF